jgi:hypothetical protein
MWVLTAAAVGLVSVSIVASRLGDASNGNVTWLAIKHGANTGFYLLIPLVFARVPRPGFARHRREAYASSIMIAAGSALSGLFELAVAKLEVLLWLGVAASVVGWVLLLDMLRRAVRQEVGARRMAAAYWASNYVRMLVGLACMVVGWLAISNAQSGLVVGDAYALATVGGIALVAAGMYLTGPPLLHALRLWRQQSRVEGSQGRPAGD